VLEGHSFSKYGVLVDNRQERLSQELPVSISARRIEIKRRRHRRKKLAIFARKLEKATVSEKGMIGEKIRNLTPGGKTIVEAWGLTKR